MLDVLSISRHHHRVIDTESSCMKVPNLFATTRSLTSPLSSSLPLWFTYHRFGLHPTLGSSDCSSPPSFPFLASSLSLWPSSHRFCLCSTLGSSDCPSVPSFSFPHLLSPAVATYHRFGLSHYSLSRLAVIDSVFVQVGPSNSILHIATPTQSGASAHWTWLWTYPVRYFSLCDAHGSYPRIGGSVIRLLNRDRGMCLLFFSMQAASSRRTKHDWFHGWGGRRGGLFWCWLP